MCPSQIKTRLQKQVKDDPGCWHSFCATREHSPTTLPAEQGVSHQEPAPSGPKAGCSGFSSCTQDRGYPCGQENLSYPRISYPIHLPGALAWTDTLRSSRLLPSCSCHALPSGLPSRCVTKHPLQTSSSHSSFPGHFQHRSTKGKCLFSPSSIQQSFYSLTNSNCSQ